MSFPLCKPSSTSGTNWPAGLLNVRPWHNHTIRFLFLQLRNLFQKPLLTHDVIKSFEQTRWSLRLCHRSEQTFWTLKLGFAHAVDGKFTAFHVHMLLLHCFPVVKIPATMLMTASVWWSTGKPTPSRSIQFQTGASGTVCLQGYRVLNKADMMLSPPNIRRPPGRPKMRILKIESLKRPKRIVQCGRCHLLGHSQKKCSLRSWCLSIDVHWTLFWQNREVHACLCLSIFLCCAVSPTSSLLQILLSYLPVGARRSK